MTGRVTPGWAKERSGELQEDCGMMAGTEKKMVGIHMRTSRKWRVGTGQVTITAIADMWTSSSEVIPAWAKMPLFKGSTSWTTPRVEFLRTRPSLTTL